jgi:hypothetical protein
MVLRRDSTVWPGRNLAETNRIRAIANGDRARPDASVSAEASLEVCPHCEARQVLSLASPTVGAETNTDSPRSSPPCLGVARAIMDKE